MQIHNFPVDKKTSQVKFLAKVKDFSRDQIYNLSVVFTHQHKVLAVTY
jgi:hypothetical protein